MWDQCGTETVLTGVRRQARGAGLPGLLCLCLRGYRMVPFWRSASESPEACHTAVQDAPDGPAGTEVNRESLFASKAPTATAGSQRSSRTPSVIYEGSEPLEVVGESFRQDGCV